MDDSAKKPDKKLDNLPRPSFFGSKRGIKGFLQDVQMEMKKVTWPTPRETTRLTGVVLAVCALVAIILFALGFGAEQILNVLIRGNR